VCRWHEAKAAVETPPAPPDASTSAGAPAAPASSVASLFTGSRAALPAQAQARMASNGSAHLRSHRPKPALATKLAAYLSSSPAALLAQEVREGVTVGVEGFDLGEVSDARELDEARAGDGGVGALAELGVVAELGGHFGRCPR
jgi:hypothetical protein